MIASVATTAGLSAQRSAEGHSPRRGGGGTTFSDNTPSAALPYGSSVAQSTDKACKQDAFVNLKVQSAQPTLSYRVGPSLGTDWHLANPLKASLRPLR